MKFLIQIHDVIINNIGKARNEFFSRYRKALRFCRIIIFEAPYNYAKFRSDQYSEGHAILMLVYIGKVALLP